MFSAGAAAIEITNELGTDIQGASVGGKAKYVRDPLEANALFLKTNDTSLLLISCDFGGLEPQPTAQARAAISLATGLSERSILIGATHTGGPSIIPTNYIKKVDQAYLAKLNQWLAQVAKEAIDSAQPAQLAWGQGQAPLGYNRRCTWADGTHTMFGDTKRPDYTGKEGPEDNTHTALAVRDLQGKWLGILQTNTSHPCTFYGADFYSADYPGLSRKHLREAMDDPKLPVLFFNGALGDQSSNDVEAPEPNNESKNQMLGRLAHLMTGQTLHLLYQAAWQKEVQLNHTHHDLKVDVRLPDAKAVDDAKALLAQVDQSLEKNQTPTIPPTQIMLAHGTVSLARNYSQNPVDTLPMHAIRINDLALASEPCELFCQYGLDIRRRSPASATAILGITDGYHGYCPTHAAILGGGYSGQPIYWTRLHPNTGDQIVDTAVKLLHELW